MKNWFLCDDGTFFTATNDYRQSQDGTGLRLFFHGTFQVRVVPGQSGDLALFDEHFYTSWMLDGIPADATILNARIELTLLNPSPPWNVTMLARHIVPQYEGTTNTGGWQEGDNGTQYPGPPLGHLQGITFQNFAGDPLYNGIPPTFESPNLGTKFLPAGMPANSIIQIDIDPVAFPLLENHFGTPIPFTSQVTQVNNTFPDQGSCPPMMDVAFWEREQACPSGPPQTPTDPGFNCGSPLMARLILHTV